MNYNRKRAKMDTGYLNLHLNDAQHLIKEAKSAGESTRKQILNEVREIIEFVVKEES